MRSWVQHSIAVAAVALSVSAGGPAVVAAASKSPVVTTEPEPHAKYPVSSFRGCVKLEIDEMLGSPSPNGDRDELECR
jgi:hypothetical protein